jgi:hypothetical protein
VLAALLRRTGHVKTIVAARATTSLLKGPAGAAVDGLLAEDGELPAKAWEAFSSATRLTARSRGAPPAPALGQDWLRSAQRYLHRLLRTVAALPSRLEELIIEAADDGGRPGWAPSQGLQLAQALLACSCRRGLQALLIDERITPDAAEALLHGLPQLKRASLSVGRCGIPAAPELMAAPPGQQGGPLLAALHAMLVAAVEAAALEDDVAESSTPVVWRPRAALPHLEELALHLHSEVRLDLACLAPATRLTELALWDCRKPVNWAAVAGLSALQVLSLQQSTAPILPSVDRLGCLSSLQQLAELELVGGRCAAADWRLLSSLPRLAYLKLHELEVQEEEEPSAAQQVSRHVLVGRRGALLCAELHWPDAGGCSLSLSEADPTRLRHLLAAAQAAAQLSPISCLHITGSLTLDVPEGRLPGCLCHQLPQLRELIVWHDQPLAQLAEALQGHPCLLSLLVNQVPEQDDEEQQQQQLLPVPVPQRPLLQAWPRQLLRQLPALQDLTLYETQLDPLQLLGDVAGCPSLQSLHIDGPEEQPPLVVASPGPLAALAAGAAAAGLQRVQIGSSLCAFTPAAVAGALLQGGLPCLQEVELAVLVPEELCSTELVEARLAGLLSQAGARVRVQCSQCSELCRRGGAGLAAFVALQLGS